MDKELLEKTLLRKGIDTEKFFSKHPDSENYDELMDKALNGEIEEVCEWPETN